MRIKSSVLTQLPRLSVIQPLRAPPALPPYPTPHHLCPRHYAPDMFWLQHSPSSPSPSSYRQSVWASPPHGNLSSRSHFITLQCTVIYHSGFPTALDSELFPLEVFLLAAKLAVWIWKLNAYAYVDYISELSSNYKVIKYEIIKLLKIILNTVISVVDFPPSLSYLFFITLAIF